MSNLRARNDKNRHFARLHVTHGVTGELQLVEIKGQPVRSKCRKVLIKQVGAEGMVFETALDFPVTLQYVVVIDVELGSVLHRLAGQIIWKQLREQLYEYGMIFILPPSARRSLIYSLNHILLKQSPQQAKIHTLYRQMNACE